MSQDPAPSATVRDDLLAAALALIVEHGDLAFSLRQLAEAADTSTMSIYTQFGNREGLYRALAGEAFELFAAGLAEVDVADNTDAPSALRAMAAAYRRFATEYPSAFDLIFGGVVSFDAVEPLVDEFEGRPAPSATGYEVYGMFASVFSNGVTAGSIRSDVPLRLVMDSYWAQMHGLVALERLGYVRSAADAGERFAFGIDTIIAGLAPPGPHS
ncbi:MAG: WHG domain-containing protein [Actinomycetota bacterium]